MYVITIKATNPYTMDCKVEFEEVKGGLSDWQRLVGGLIEVVPTPHPDIEMLINEEGKLDGLPFNPIATLIYPFREYDFLVGTAVIVRLNKRRDNWTGWKTKEDAENALYALLDAVNANLDGSTD